MQFNYLLVVFAPFIGFCITFLTILVENIFSAKVNSKITSLAVVVLTLFSTTLSLKLFYLASTLKFSAYWLNFKLGPWFSINSYFLESNSMVLNWGFLFDSLSITMFLVITFVSVLVQLYAIEYMSHDLNRTRFMGYLALFVFFMIMLISSDNYLQVFIGWEGVGLVSYLLINFWYTRVEAARSALKAVGVNKFGDYAFIIAVIFLFKIFGTVEFEVIFDDVYLVLNQNFSFLNYEISAITFISFFLLVAAVGKSAQLGLHTWLPDAMEGPTPVSALIHAATMVTAGVYLLVRSSPIIEFAPNILSLTAIIGASTALFGASTALFQNDLKKVIAYSTCSQLGYMVCACGLSAYSAAMFHLVTHAFFKALLFLCAGSVIHALADEQDMRKMGGLAKILPFTYIMMTIGSLALMGFPFLSGYFSKDLILEIAASTHTAVGLYCFVMGSFAAIFTALYSVRLAVLTFLTKTNAFKNNIDHAHEAPLLMAIPLLLLGMLSVVAGFFLKPVFIDFKTGEPNYQFWKFSIYISDINITNRLDVHQLDSFVKNIPTLCVFFAVFLAIFIYFYKDLSFYITNNHLLKGFNNTKKQIMVMHKPFLSFAGFPKLIKYYHTKFFTKPILSLYYFFNKKWYFDVVYNNYIVIKSYIFSYNTIFKAIDRGFFNIFLAPKLFDFILKIVKKVIELQTGLLYTYVFLILISILLIIAILFFLV